ncbi:MAG: shikimate kinase [Pseudomonadota bacterium]
MADASTEDKGAYAPKSSPLPFRDRPIALVGLMGVGKTTVGRRLARSLDRAFFDSDEEIERASGRTVAGYFAIMAKRPSGTVNVVSSTVF